MLSIVLSYRLQKKVYTDNHSDISARQRDSKVSMTDLVSAEDNVNIRVSSGPPPLDDKRVQNDHNLSLRAIRHDCV